MRLADTIASMPDAEDFILDVMMCGDQQAIELMVAALMELDEDRRALTVLDVVAEADRRDDDAQVAAARLFAAVRER